ncbi:MAG: ATP-binding protein [Alphaproteobacteria bacterium]|nr:ATP-binding protein [Alphaproteobacteria bacterium]
MTDPMLHMICGGVGAGKTTYALGLSRRLGGIHFSIDEWMTALFGRDTPPRLRWDWIAERATRCEALIARMACQSAYLGVPAVLDQAFLCAADRARLVAIAEQERLSVQLHYLDVPSDERWRRVTARNVDKGNTFTIELTREMFDFFEKRWEPPTAVELAKFRGVHIGSHPPY